MKSGGSQEQLQAFFERPPCLKASAQLQEGSQIQIIVETESPLTLQVSQGRIEVLGAAAPKADMTFYLPKASLEQLISYDTNEVGDLGIELAKLLIHSDASRRVLLTVHRGPLELFRRGYFKVLSLGGGPLMKFLAAQGLGGINKIKESLSRLRG